LVLYRRWRRAWMRRYREKAADSPDEKSKIVSFGQERRLEYPSPDDPDRFEERLRTRFLICAGLIVLALAIGIASILASPPNPWNV
jgi:hypothetical protein